MFAQKYFCESRGISLSTCRDTGRGKAAYIWISPDPAKARATLGGGGGGGSGNPYPPLIRYCSYSLQTIG